MSLRDITHGVFKSLDKAQRQWDGASRHKHARPDVTRRVARRKHAGDFDTWRLT
jgi:hypothetical protein